MGWVDPYLRLWLCRHSRFSQRVLAGIAREAHQGLPKEAGQRPSGRKRGEQN